MAPPCMTFPRTNEAVRLRHPTSDRYQAKRFLTGAAFTRYKSPGRARTAVSQNHDRICTSENE
jgi:hypothetical protein